MNDEQLKEFGEFVKLFPNPLVWVGCKIIDKIITPELIYTLNYRKNLSEWKK